MGLLAFLCNGEMPDPVKQGQWEERSMGSMVNKEAIY